MSTVYLKDNLIKASGSLTIVSHSSLNSSVSKVSIVCILIKENKTIENRKTVSNIMQAI